MNVSARVKLMGDLQATITEDITRTLIERGRGYASDREAWAELKERIEAANETQKNIEKLHREMWNEVKGRNEEAFIVLAQELGRVAARLAEEWAHTAALARIAVTGPEAADELIQREEKKSE